MGEPGVPAEAERAVNQDLVAADRDVGADLEIGPAELVLDLLVTLLDPVADAVQAHDLGQARRRVRAARLARPARAGQVRDQVPGALARQRRPVRGCGPPGRPSPSQRTSPGCKARRAPGNTAAHQPTPW